jgi:hypothetical protein
MNKLKSKQTILCACGCGTKRLRFDKVGRERLFCVGHYNKTVPSPLKGKKRPPFSAEWRKKIGLSGLGRPGAWTGKSRPDISGGKHYNWKGGITKLQEKVRKSDIYSKWRTSVFERDNYTCTWCGARNGNGKRVVLHADHIKPFCVILKEYKVTSIAMSRACVALWDIGNGRTLCKDCHLKTDTHGYNAIKNYEDIN